MNIEVDLQTSARPSVFSEFANWSALVIPFIAIVFFASHSGVVVVTSAACLSLNAGYWILRSKKILRPTNTGAFVRVSANCIEFRQRGIVSRIYRIEWNEVSELQINVKSLNAVTTNRGLICINLSCLSFTDFLLLKSLVESIRSHKIHQDLNGK